MSKVLLSFLLPFGLLLLAACTAGVSQPVTAPGVSEPAIIPPGEPGGPPMGTSPAGGEKVVQMATRTPTTDRPMEPPTLTPSNLAYVWPTPIVLSGVQMTPYTDAVTGFSFQYPGNWQITDLPDSIKKDSTAYTISLRSPGPTPGPKQMDGIMPGVSAIDITVLRNDAKTLAQAADERRQAAAINERGPLKIALDKTVTLPNGLEAQYFIYQDADDNFTSQVVTLVNEKTLIISGFGDQTLFTTVAGTLKK